MDEKKRPSEGDAPEIPQKSPRLEQPTDLIDPWRQIGSNGGTHRCQHLLCGQDDIDLAITLIKTSIDSPICNVCKCDDSEGRIFLVCLDCEWRHCTRHAEQHAQVTRHWIALMYIAPNVAHCFACDDSYSISGVLFGERMAVDKGEFSISACNKDDKGMMVDNEADDHASAVTEASTSDIGTPRCDHYSIYTEDEIDQVQRLVISGNITRMCSSDCDNSRGLMIFVCLGCQKTFCTAHAYEHVKNTKHLIALLYHTPCLACCFQCDRISVLIVEVDGRMPVDNETGGRASGSVIGHANAIKGIPNLGNTCYLNSLCLLVLGRLRARILEPDAQMGRLGKVLRCLFEDTDCVNNSGGTLDPTMLLDCVRTLEPRFVGTPMEDSHEALCCLRNGLDNEERMIKSRNMQDGFPSAMAPTVFYSVFGGGLSFTILCKRCSFRSVSHAVFHDLSVPIPPKKSSAKSVESPAWTKAHRSQQKIHSNLFEPIQKRNTDKTHTIAEDTDSQSIASELEDVVMVKTSEALGVDSTEVEQISQSKDVAQDPLQIQTDKVQGKATFPQHVLFDVKIEGMDVATTDCHIPEDIGPPPPVPPLREENAQIESSTDVGKNDSAVLDDVYSEPEISSEPKTDIFSAEVTTEDKGRTGSSDIVCEKAQNIETLASIDECLELYFKAQMIEWVCENCSKVAQKLDIIQGIYSGPILSSINEDTTVGDKRGHSEKVTCQSEQCNKRPECCEGVQDAVPSCVPSEKQNNFLSSQYQNTTLDDVSGNHSANQVEESQNELKDGNKGPIQTCLISKLPHVLAIHLKRNLGPNKVIGHISFKETLDMGLSEDKDNSHYRLVGVVEHQGPGNNTGHFVAYVRASPRQQTSGSSSWFCASDDDIREISLEEVLKCEAYLLFYERMEG
uniref:Uncharacterized protein n=1 Tax=Leersia perrieri TaxID=77586 RepID=A0A0D9XA18_9ORYZ